MAYRQHAQQLETTTTAEPQHTPELEEFKQSRQTAVSLLAAMGSNPNAQTNKLYHQTNGNLARAGDTLLQLQNQYGNQYVQQVINPQQQLTIQPKLMLGDVDTPSEREADQFANQVMRKPQMTNSPTPVSGPMTAVSPQIESAINQAKGSGQPLTTGIQSQMSHSLGTDLSNVRVHTDSRADTLNQSLQAKAFTTGQDIFFRQGAYSPGTSNGQQLLAHELTHVAQQTSADTSQQIASPKPLIQRKIGFEFEMALPTIPATPLTTALQDYQSDVDHWNAIKRQKKNISDWTTKFQTASAHAGGTPYAQKYAGKFDNKLGYFLWGGLPYSSEIGVVGKTDMKTDHGPIKNFHTELLDVILQNINILSEDQVALMTSQRKAMSNIEYATKPFDETEEDADVKIKQEIDKIVVHMNKTFKLAQSKKMQLIPKTDNQIYTGIPYDLMQAWLGKHPRWHVVKLALDKLQRKISDKIYIQSTVGYIPSAFSDLFESARIKREFRRDRPYVQKAAHKTRVVVNRTIQAIEASPDHQDEYNALSEPAKKSFKGFLLLIASYGIGEAINQTTALPLRSSSKNVVPFLVQMSDLAEAYSAIHDEVADLSFEICKFAADRLAVSDYYTREKWASILDDVQVAPNTEQYKKRQPGKFLYHADGKNFAAIAYDILIGETGKVKTMAPGTLNLESIPAEAEAPSGNQSGIPVEHRAIGDMPQPKNLWPFVKRYVEEVRNLNKQHGT